MGSGPWSAQEDDVVMLVAGASVPYIFRPVDKEETSWILVGEAYCHGVMAGDDILGNQVPALKLENYQDIVVV